MDYEQLRKVIDRFPGKFGMIHADEGDCHGMACDIEDGLFPDKLITAQNLYKQYFIK